MSLQVEPYETSAGRENTCKPCTHDPTVAVEGSERQFGTPGVEGFGVVSELSKAFKKV